MQQLPAYISIVFVLITLLTVYFFYKVANNSKVTLTVLLVWLALQGLIGLQGFYTETKGFPPRFFLLVLPALLCIILLFVTKSGRRYLDLLDQRWLTLLHVVRIPVELVLFWLFVYKAIPQLMTFEGRNLDILSGITAPFIWYFGYIRKRLPRTALIIWNFVCLALLINIVAIAILSAPFPFQNFAFDQPNVAILYFPFIWLPCCIVPLVLLSHLAALRQLFRGKTAANFRVIMMSY